MKKELIVVLLLLLLSFPAVRYLLLPGGFTSHDLTHHVVRQISMDRLLLEGQFPPRWSGQLNNGYGYPVFLFNYPLPALFGEIFHKLGFNFLYSVKAVLFSSMLLSVVGMYLFLRAYLGTKLSAFLGAMFYLYVPLRFLNVYVSAAAGSALAAALVPFVFLSMVQIKKTRKLLWILLGSLFFALLILSHNVTTLIFLPLLLGFAVVLILESKERFRVFRDFGVMFLLGVAMSAWFWLPAVFEKKFIIFDEVFGDFYKTQFISLQQMLRSPWGFGLSHPESTENGDLSYQIGLVHLLAMTFLVLAVFLFRKIRYIGIFILSFFVLSLLLIHKISKPFWDLVPVMALIQFPLRFSAVSVFTASIGVAFLIKCLPFKRTIFLAFLILIIYANRNHWKINEVYDPGENYYLSLKTTSTSFDEHLPKWARKMEKAPVSKLEFIEGEGTIKTIKDQSARIFAYSEASRSSKLRLNQFYFPGWQILVDGQAVGFDYEIEGESYGLPVFDIDSGKHQVLAEFKNTPDRNLADTASFISVVVWLILLCRWLILR